MRLRTITAAALLGISFSMGAAAQNASSVISAASTAMGAANLNSITFSGTARNGAFGQSKSIGDPLGPVNATQITQYTRTINLVPGADAAALVSRATGPTQPPTVPGAPAPVPGVFNQGVLGTADQDWETLMPEGKRPTSEQMNRQATTYYVMMEDPKNDPGFATPCRRWENGTTGGKRE